VQEKAISVHELKISTNIIITWLFNYVSVRTSLNNVCPLPLTRNIEMAVVMKKKVKIQKNILMIIANDHGKENRDIDRRV
jgi:hypothetical protein